MRAVRAAVDAFDRLVDAVDDFDEENPAESIARLQEEYEKVRDAVTCLRETL